MKTKAKSRVRFKDIKPPTPGWKYGKLNNEEREKVKNDLFSSPRGSLILGQAFAIAYAKLKDTEPSNAEDLSLIAEHLSPFFYSLHLAQLKVSDGRNGFAG